MSLLLWYPLNGSNENKGFPIVTTSNVGSVVYNDTGKIGKCFNHSTDSPAISINSNLINELGTEYSMAIWVCPTNTHTHYNGTFISSGNWNGYRWAFGVSQDNSQVDVLGPGCNNYITCSVPINTWTHLVSTMSSDGTAKLYKNGVYVGIYKYSSAVLTSDASTTMIGRETYANGYFGFRGKLNDLRIYNHCLSLKEIKELAQAKIIHYSFNSNFSLAQNQFVYPTFDTSYLSGGWEHWTDSTGVGSYTQTTDKNFIYNKSNTYAHRVTCTTKGAYEYLVYQSPSFTGGYRSIAAIIKSSILEPITNSVCYPTCNGNNGSVPGGSWTTIIPLKDDFYLCKWEGFSQDGSNNLVGIYVKEGKTIYISECYLENSETISNILFPNTDYCLEDESGYNNNGILIDNSPVYSYDGSRGGGCVKFNGTQNAINIGNLATLCPEGIFTMSCWFKRNTAQWGTDTNETIFGGPTGFELETKPGSTNSPIIRPYSWGGSTGTYDIPYTLNTWHHIVMVRNSDNCLIYLDGVLKQTCSRGSIPTGSYFIGSCGDASSQKYCGFIDDFKLYNTALTAEEIMTLYKSTISINKEGQWFASSFKEQLQNCIPTINETIFNKKFSDSVSSYTQSNCLVTNTDGRIHVYRPPNLTPSTNGNTMWGGVKLLFLSATPNCLKQGNTYLLTFIVEGKTSGAVVNVGFSNNMGWSGGGLSPYPTILLNDTAIPANFNGIKQCTYAFRIDDSIYKTCTASYSSFVAGTSYISYKHFQIGWSYSATGPLGTDMYFSNFNLYDITDTTLQTVVFNNKGSIELSLNELDACKPMISKFGTLAGTSFNELY